MVAEKGFWSPSIPAVNIRPTGRAGPPFGSPWSVDNTLRVLNLLRAEFGRWLPISLMSQYKPTTAARQHPDFDRHLSCEEYQTALAHAQALGFENLLVQPLATTDDFFPDFQRPKPFRGNP